MAKKLKAIVRLQLEAGKANPAPPVGPALASHGINIMAFCKDFNAKTEKMTKGMPIPVVISVHEDKSFVFIMKQPPNTYWIKEAIKLKSGSKLPGRDIVGSITTAQLRKIAEDKMQDMNATSIEGAVRILAGSARSMGLEVKEA